ncbi:MULTISPECIES: hypothetical protein [Streptomyces]|uniref:Uncharacterized protein n=1 Tax=Streptomyces sudanensis TaxID=436397 RepID=A0ABY4TDG4_9ACTN|nr:MULTISPECIES: hypothetical protein [Streptomyces]MCP9957834.1 hypothetical protein [Streptomyces sudanensis]MCP9986964.1 hypothetical protein [Streptomyces sudanensis]MCQ0001626.1 hypothetical protein [Streptomyces sudanensis]URN15526.1 hypothetical protein MW084_05700 [Streptomyces sudanensis]
MTPTVYTIEMAYAQMRYLQEQAHGSRVPRVVAAARREAASERRTAKFRTKKR